MAPPPPRLLPLLRRLRGAARGATEQGCSGSVPARASAAAASASTPASSSPAAALLHHHHHHRCNYTYSSGSGLPAAFAAANAAASSASASSRSPAGSAASPLSAYARRRNPYLRDAEARARRRASAWAVFVGSTFVLTTGAILAAAPGDDDDESDEDWRRLQTPAEALAAAEAAAAAALAAAGSGAPAPSRPAEAALAAAASGAPAPSSSDGVASSDGVVASGRKLLPLHLRRRIFFKYEKRIREMSSLEKVFDYYASIVAPEATGATAMTGTATTATTTTTGATGTTTGATGTATAAATTAATTTAAATTSPSSAPSPNTPNTPTHTIMARHMTARDLVRAVVPTYPPATSDVERAGRLPGEPGAHARSERELRNHAGLEDSVFKRFDVNGDGLISYAEFVLVVNLLAIPEDEVRAVFETVDVDGSGDLDAAEFSAVMRMIERRAGVRASFLPRPGKHAPSSANAAAEDAALLRFFFGRDGRGTLKLAQWRDFITALHADVRRLEFAHYDTNGDGECSAEDFATALVTAADVRAVDGLLDRAEALPPAVRRLRVKQADFEAVAKARAARRQLAVALTFCRSMGRPVTASELRRLLTRITGAEFRPEIVAIIMHVFAAAAAAPEAPLVAAAAVGAGGGAGVAAAAASVEPTLDVPLFLDVMRRRSRVPGQQHHDVGGGAGGKKGGGAGGKAAAAAGGGGAEVGNLDGDDDEDDEPSGPLGKAWARIVRTITRGGGGGDDDD